MKIRETTFGQLRRGDRFALSPGPLERGADDYMNIKIDPAVLCEPPFDPPMPFNVIALGDGRVRTFRDEEKVFVLGE